jgi:hypothetical protein
VRAAADTPPLFAAGPFRAVELRAADVPALQRFFDTNPEYHLAVGGQAPEGREAHDAFHGAPPPDMAYTRKWLLGFVDTTGALVAVADVVSDLVAPGVWHIGLYIVATALHGGGAAHTMYGALEGWIRGQGAIWLRLGVVEGNARAERFWSRGGYVEVRKRDGIAMGRLTRTVRVMLKPLAGATVADYLALVERDRPEHH